MKAATSKKGRISEISSNPQGVNLRICLLLVVLTVVVFWRVPFCEFVEFDDDVYVLEEEHVTGGLTWQSFLWTFTFGHAEMWHPLTSLSHIIDYQLFKDNPIGHHTVNLLLHTANVIILFLILKAMTGFLWPSAFVAALFAIHPLQIESVAWVSERKTLTSGFFWMLTIAAYIHYAEKPKFGRYFLAIFAFALAVLSKPMVVTLPVVLLLLDYWPLRRIRLFENTELKTTRTDFLPASIKRLVLEKIPFLVLTGILSVVTFHVQESKNALKTFDSFPLQARIFNAIFSYVKYIEKMFYPVNLAIFYPHPQSGLTIEKVAVSAVLLIVISVLIIRMAKQRKYLLVGWLWFLGVLVPVIGLVQVGAQAMADRYAYLSFIGLFIIIAWGVPDLLSKVQNRKIILASLSVLVLLALSIHTSLQLRYWRNSVDLFEHAVKVTEGNYPMHNNLCVIYNRMEKYDKAIEHGAKAVLAKPDFARLYYNLGIPLLRAGRIDEAVKCWERNITLGGIDSKVHTNLGSVYYSRGKIDLAIEHFLRAVEIDENFLANAKLGRIMTNKGDFALALDYYRRSLEANPNRSDIRYEYALLLENQGRFDEAIKQYQLILKFTPDFQKARKALDAVLQKNELRTPR